MAAKWLLLKGVCFYAFTKAFCQIKYENHHNACISSFTSSCCLLVDLKAQPDPSPILSQLTQNSALQSDLPAQVRNPAPLPPHDGPSPSLKPLSEPAVTMAEPPQPKNIRLQRRRVPPPSKVMIVACYLLHCLCPCIAERLTSSSHY